MSLAIGEVEFPQWLLHCANLGESFSHSKPWYSVIFLWVFAEKYIKLYSLSFSACLSLSHQSLMEPKLASNSLVKHDLEFLILLSLCLEC